MNVQPIKLDVSKKVSPTQYIRISQGDRNGTTIRASLYDNGAALSLSGKTVRFCMRIPASNLYVRSNATVSGNVATYVVDESYCARSVGLAENCYFEVVQGTTVIASTNRFSIQVLKGITTGVEPAEQWDDAINDLIHRGNSSMDAYDAAESMRAAAESVRASAESVRATAETARGNAEAARSSAEGTRVSNEATRKNNELQRVGAETSRASAESTRVTEFDTLKSESEAATDRANEAAENAEAVVQAGIPLATASRRGGARLSAGLVTVNEQLMVRSTATWEQLFT